MTDEQTDAPQPAEKPKHRRAAHHAAPKQVDVAITVDEHGKCVGTVDGEEVSSGKVIAVAFVETKRAALDAAQERGIPLGY